MNHTVPIMVENRKAFVSSLSCLSNVAGIPGVGESARMLNASFQKLSSKPAERPPRQHRNGNHITYYSEESASISSVRSLSSLSIAAWTDDGGLTGSHASTLDRLYAWEKKLHLEVKVCFLELLLIFDTNTPT